MRISDWSSDVCSSDLDIKHVLDPRAMRLEQLRAMLGHEADIGRDLADRAQIPVVELRFLIGGEIDRGKIEPRPEGLDLGRPSFREFGWNFGSLRDDRKSTRLNSSH